jgi:hypothetical protein
MQSRGVTLIEYNSYHLHGVINFDNNFNRIQGVSEKNSTLSNSKTINMHNIYIYVWNGIFVACERYSMLSLRVIVKKRLFVYPARTSPPPN